MDVHESVRLFSPKYSGSKEAWEWICHASNGRQTQIPKLNPQQIAYALRVGWLNNAEAMSNGS